jgi:hypothetical protein
LGIAAWLAALPAAAQEPVAVAGLTVSPAVKCMPARSPADTSVPQPHVVSSFPAQGAVVRPGKLILRLTFDLPMACGGTFLDAPPISSPLPDGNRVVYLSPDRKTFRVIGYASRNARYGVRLNVAPVHDFQGLSGQPLQPFDLAFRTSNGPPVLTEAEALAQDVEGRR